jgi:thioredoxin-like negative regulator of GroEL
MLTAVTDHDFDRVIEHAATPVLVGFWRPGCGHCRALMTELEALARDAGPRFRS